MPRHAAPVPARGTRPARGPACWSSSRLRRYVETHPPAHVGLDTPAPRPTRPAWIARADPQRALRPSQGPARVQSQPWLPVNRPVPGPAVFTEPRTRPVVGPTSREWTRTGLAPRGTGTIRRAEAGFASRTCSGQKYGTWNALRHAESGRSDEPETNSRAGRAAGRSPAREMRFGTRNRADPTSRRRIHEPEVQRAGLRHVECTSARGMRRKRRAGRGSACRTRFRLLDVPACGGSGPSPGPRILAGSGALRPAEGREGGGTHWGEQVPPRRRGIGGNHMRR